MRVTDLAHASTVPPPPPPLSAEDEDARAWTLASILHGEAAERYAPETLDGVMARLCAISAALAGGSYRRARLLAEHYIATDGRRLPERARTLLRTWSSRAMIGMMRGAW